VRKRTPRICLVADEQQTGTRGSFLSARQAQQQTLGQQTKVQGKQNEGARQMPL